MSNSSKIFMLIVLVTSLLGIFMTTENVQASDSAPEINEVYSGNIREIESRRFTNVIESSKILTVYEVYGHKVLVVETTSKNDISVIKLD